VKTIWHLIIEITISMLGKAVILQGEGMEGPQKRRDTKFDTLGKA
jgi:hypothetical protein